MTTCLVTGAAGFIGSHLAERLVRDGHDVVGLDCFTDYYPRSIKEQNLANLRQESRFKFIEADLLEIDLSRLLCGDEGSHRKMDWVFHLAAQAGVRSSWGSSFEIYTRNNVLATQRLLEAAKDVPPKKFVFASSSSIYGDAETLPTGEDITPRPLSPYGVTKLACEHLCRLYWRTYGVPTVRLRYFTVYGPRQRPDMAFHRFIRAALSDEEIVVYGDGEQTRDFTYVADTVEGTVRAAIAGVPGEVYNIGGGSRVSVNQVLAELEKILGKRVCVHYTKSQQGDARHTSADIGRVVRDWVYKPQTNLVNGLRVEFRWLSSEKS